MTENPTEEIISFEKELEEEAKKKKWSPYPKFQCASARDLFPKYQNWKWLKASKDDYGVPSKQYLAVKIFTIFMQKVVEDIIENNDYFKFPAFKAALVIEAIPDHIFQRLRQNGKLVFVNSVKSGGKYYRMVYRFKRRDVCFKYQVILDKNHFNRLLELINSGKTYFNYAEKW